MVAKFVHYTAAATHDLYLLYQFSLNEGDFICFDKAYIDYQRFHEYTQQGVYFITRMKDNAVYQRIEELVIPEQADNGKSY